MAEPATKRRPPEGITVRNGKTAAPRPGVAENRFSDRGMPTGDASGPTALSLLVDLDSNDVSRMEEMSLASAGLRERQDLQRWITEHPDLVATGLLLITTEFDR